MSIYPKFLKVKPKTLGLGPVDFALIVVSLFIGLALSLTNITTLILSAVMILVYRVLSVYFDFQMLLINRTKQSILSDLAKKDVNERSF